MTKEIDNLKIKEFQLLFSNYIKQSEFGAYVLEWPRGYPGDFVSQEMIWNSRTLEDRYKFCGTTRVGEILNFLNLEMECPKANIDRMLRLGGLIQCSGTRIASIGCGSAIELWDKNIIKNKKDIFLLDMDAGALKRAEENIDKSLSATISYHHNNIIKFILNNNNILGKRDLIYSFGLFDYFDLKNSKRLIRSLWKNIDNGGTLIISNIHPNNPSKFWMEYCGLWFLDHKTESDMASLADDLEDVKNIEVELDKYSVYQFLKIQKKTK